MNPEVLWKNEKKKDFMKDLKSFSSGLDFYEISFNLEKGDGKYVVFKNSQYQILEKESKNSFSCPDCGKRKFEVLIGELGGKPAVGLACNNCESYGAVFPNGM